jgi:receptor expression-enhancing protein 5/6
VVQGILALMMVLVVFGVLESFLTNLIGVAYPLFMSLYALENEKTDDDKQWLTYWVIFGIFSLIDLTVGFLWNLIPFYYILKLAFFIWLAHPST